MYHRIVKRVLDAVGAIIALVLLLPLLALVALVIKFEDGGPAIFRQQRVGRRGDAFTIYKFRSMPVATPDVPSAAAASLTVTRVGRFIRRSNIDELPQLINILRGDMSFVGPRPALPAQASLVEQRQIHGILALRPGLTGLAQVNGYDGMPDAEKVDWERRYLQRVSLAGDLSILVQTVGYLFKPPPRY